MQCVSSGALGLCMNVDTANCAFFVAQDFEQLVLTFFHNFDRKWRGSKGDPSSKFLMLD